MLSAPPIRSDRPWTQSPWVALGLAAAVAALLGLLASAVSPLAAGILPVGLVIAVVILRRPLAGLFLFVAVVGTLPFGVIPLQLGVQLTFVDAVLIATLVGFLPRVLNAAREPGGVTLGAPAGLLLLFVAVAIVAFVAGTSYSPATPELIRRFAKLVASLLIFPVAVLLLRDRWVGESLTRALMLAGALAGLVGTVLWLLPPLTQLRLLSSLQAIGYPTDSVLRYVPGPNDTYTDQLRATGTAVDPNVFGGTLLLVLAPIVIQWLGRAPLFPRPVLVLLGLPVAAGMLASLSRSSWLGIAVGLLFIGSLRYRRIWLLAALAGVVLLVSPIGQDVVERFVSGFSTQDRATAFRFGEYRNALTIIQRYPLLGIGFGTSPDIDVTAGVSSVYLLVAEQTGLLGLSVYLATLAMTFLTGLRALRSATDERDRALLAGLLAGLTGALVTNLLDHYFANQVFPHAVALFWLYCGLLVATARRVLGSNGAAVSGEPGEGNQAYLVRPDPRRT